MRHFTACTPFVRHVQTDVARQLFYRVNITQTGILHDETDGRAMRAEAEAMVELFALTDRKGRRFFVMEGTAGGVVGTRFFEWHVTLHHIDDIEAIEQILNETFWNQTRPPSRSRWQQVPWVRL